LQGESFVRPMPRRGFVIKSFSKGDLTDQFWAQELAARAAARKPYRAIYCGHREGQLQDAVAYHPITMDAIRVRDAGAVRSLMYRHIASGAEHLVAMLERHGNWRPAEPEPTTRWGGKGPISCAFRKIMHNA